MQVVRMTNITVKINTLEAFLLRRHAQPPTQPAHTPTSLQEQLYINISKEVDQCLSTLGKYTVHLLKMWH